MLSDLNCHKLVMNADSNSSGQQLALVIKRLLLMHRSSSGVAVEIATVQALIVILNGPCGNQFAVAVLQADLAGKLFPLVIQRRQWQVWVTLLSQ